MIKFNETKNREYFASRDGGIYSIAKISNKKLRLKLSASKTDKWDKQGYLQFGIKINSKTKTFKVHRIIADLYLDKQTENKYLEVNHIDGNKHNNNFSNLEWITRKQNCNHARKLGLINKPDVKREKNPFFGKTKHHISLIRSGIYLIKNGKSLKYASERTGIAYKLMSQYWCQRDDLWSRI